MMIVEKWKNLKEIGIKNENGQTIKFTLDQAAAMVGLSRKTLDDYQLQIKRGQKYGFDF